MPIKFSTVLLTLALCSSLLGQSKRSQQLQQQLNNRKSVTNQTSEETAPTTQPNNSSAGVAPQSPQEFTTALQRAIVEKNLDAFNSLVSWSHIAKQATRDLSGKPIAEFQVNLMKDIHGKNSLGAKIMANVASGGSYKFMRLKKNNKTVVAIFRMLLSGNRGVNYHEFALAKTKNGQVVASDIYVFLTGELLSQSIRRNLITTLDQATDVNLTGKDKLLSQNLQTIEALTNALSKNNANEARSKILELPKELRTDKAIQSLTLNTYKNSAAFGTVLKSVHQLYPDDVFMDMIAIDVFARQKKYGDAIVAIKRINQRVGEDPYLKILNARMLLNQKKVTLGRQMIQQAISDDDSLLSGYWNLVSFSLQDQEHEETLRLLKLIHAKFKIKFKDLSAIPSYRKFVESEAYKRWTDYLDRETVSTPTKPESSNNQPLTQRKKPENKPRVAAKPAGNSN
ncbi:MAG: hypothetical protein VX438_02735 [Planctomycetota bacterium]|nr:hypothetical protein [Planctomycetota bacterium]